MAFHSFPIWVGKNSGCDVAKEWSMLLVIAPSSSDSPVVSCILYEAWCVKVNIKRPVKITGVTLTVYTITMAHKELFDFEHLLAQFTASKTPENNILIEHYLNAFHDLSRWVIFTCFDT